MAPPRWILAWSVFIAVLGVGLVAVAQLPPTPPPPSAPPVSAGPVRVPSTVDASGPADALYEAAVADAELGVASAYNPTADADPSALVEFRGVLEPYGRWLEDPTYGTVWVPSTASVGPDFAPYRTAGHWAIADDGQWLWVSDYDWGYVPFHYGRWVWLETLGWAWIPGRVYAPAWVLWRTGLYGYDYVGWAPMPPSFVWMNGLAVGVVWGLAVPWWFCPSAYLFTPGWYRHIVHDRAIAQRLVANSRVSGAPAPAAPARATAVRPAPIELRRLARSPSLTEARIPRAAIPQTRVPHDVRALALKGALPNRSPVPSLGEPSRATTRPAERVLRAESSSTSLAPATRVIRTAPSERPASRVSRAAPSLARPSGMRVVRAEPPSTSSRSPGVVAPPSSARAARSYAPPTRSYAPPARSYAPPMRSYSPPMRSYSPPMRSYSPPMRSFGGGRR
ncbi:MAG: hypothetical protein FJ096_04525 [Deltaproteobacteria bacterium]|nr:hypothetical protein [Deltaproteobacteria bacterium]